MRLTPRKEYYWMIIQMQKTQWQTDLYYFTIIRPGIVFSIQILSRLKYESQKSHWDVVIRILQYIKGTLGQDLLFSFGKSIILKVFCDLDMENYHAARMSVIIVCNKNVS